MCADTLKSKTYLNKHSTTTSSSAADCACVRLLGQLYSSFKRVIPIANQFIYYHFHLDQTHKSIYVRLVNGKYALAHTVRINLQIEKRNCQDKITKMARNLWKTYERRESCQQMSANLPSSSSSSLNRHSMDGQIVDHE